jgi:hypothetical protein
MAGDFMRALAWGIFSLVLVSGYAMAESSVTHVPMHSAGTATYYVKGRIEGYGSTELLVDTGSGYSTIGEDALDVLMKEGTATYLRDLNGIMADGSRRVVPLYLISGITLGSNCVIRKVEVAVFPSKTRPILGLSALRKVAPFMFSIEPPTLMLSRCSEGAVNLSAVDTELEGVVYPPSVK